MRRRFLASLFAFPGLGLVASADLTGKNATFANPAIFVGLVQWSDKVITE